MRRHQPEGKHLDFIDLDILERTCIAGREGEADYSKDLVGSTWYWRISQVISGRQLGRLLIIFERARDDRYT